MIRAILWKEWHQHRSKYVGYWFTLNAPLLLLALAIGLSSYARIPFADLSNAMTLKYLPLALVEALLVLTVFLILTGYLAVATFSPEIEDHSLFFMLEQPLSRRRYLGLKLLHGACHVTLATSFAILLFPGAVYLMMLLSGKVTIAGSSGTFALVMGVAGRAAVWCSLISVASFTASTVISALMPRWWLICSVVLTVMFIGWGEDYFTYLPGTPNESMSIGIGFGSGNAPWVTISRAFKPAELNAIAQWWPWPLLTTVLLIALFSVATAVLYDRKELK